MLSLTIYISFIGAIVIGTLIPANPPRIARVLALMVAVAGLAFAVAGFIAGAGQGSVVIVDKLWVPAMGIHYMLVEMCIRDRSEAAAPAVNVHDIGVALVGRYVLPLEILALLLTAATIGAVMVALHEKERAK